MCDIERIPSICVHKNQFIQGNLHEKLTLGDDLKQKMRK